MKKNSIIIFIFALFSSNLWASDFTAVISLERTQTGLVMKRSGDGSSIPFKATSDEVKGKIQSVADKKEALVVGRIDYERSSDGGLQPIFMIERLTFVSLRELGDVERSLPEPVYSFNKGLAFVPYTFPVTTEVASALTLTSSLLLMNSLTSGEQKDVRNDIRNGLFISAGTMATILFLYEQLSGKTKP